MSLLDYAAQYVTDGDHEGAAMILSTVNHRRRLGLLEAPIA